jgi:hypothetical protein
MWGGGGVVVGDCRVGQGGGESDGDEVVRRGDGDAVSTAGRTGGGRAGWHGGRR